MPCLINFSDICQNTGVQRIDNGYLTSPFYPRNYLPNEHCTIQLQTRPGFVFSFRFDDFQIQMPEPNGICYDHVTLYNADSEDDQRLIGRYTVYTVNKKALWGQPTLIIHSFSYCGNNTPVFQPNFTSSNFLTVEFVTDSFSQARGFNLTFTTSNITVSDKK